MERPSKHEVVDAYGRSLRPIGGTTFKLGRPTLDFGTTITLGLSGIGLMLTGYLKAGVLLSLLSLVVPLLWASTDLSALKETRVKEISGSVWLYILCYIGIFCVAANIFITAMSRPSVEDQLLSEIIKIINTPGGVANLLAQATTKQVTNTPADDPRGVLKKRALLLSKDILEWVAQGQKNEPEGPPWVTFADPRHPTPEEQASRNKQFKEWEDQNHAYWVNLVNEWKIQFNPQIVSLRQSFADQGIPESDWEYPLEQDIHDINPEMWQNTALEIVRVANRLPG
jgi:hypothetical protein